GGDPADGLVGGQAVVAVGVDQHALVAPCLGQAVTVQRRVRRAAGATPPPWLLPSVRLPPSSGGSPGGWTTTRTGRPYLRANSRSRWAWAGTAMIAPGPYPIRHEAGDQSRTRSALTAL